MTVAIIPAPIPGPIYALAGNMNKKFISITFFSA
jgi:hypothetical protein